MAKEPKEMSNEALEAERDKIAARMDEDRARFRELGIELDKRLQVAELPDRDVLEREKAELERKLALLDES